jgi:hypothetical protein
MRSRRRSATAPGGAGNGEGPAVTRPSRITRRSAVCLDFFVRSLDRFARVAETFFMEEPA